MGKLSKNVLGSFSGRVGNVIGSSWRGIPYLKSSPGPRTKEISDKEKANRQKFKLAQDWLAPLIEFVRQGFKGYSQTVEGFLAAKSYLSKNAMEFDGAEWKVNPTLMKVSYGTLPLSKNIAVEIKVEKMLLFTWDKAKVEGASGKDQVMLLAYDIEHKMVTHTTEGNFRESGSATLQTEYNKGQICLIYVAFVANDRSRQSDSVYLGEVTF